MATDVSMAASRGRALHFPRAEQGQIQAEREAEARRVAARARLDSDVRSALADGLPAEEIARIVARALREGGDAGPAPTRSSPRAVGAEEVRIAIALKGRRSQGLRGRADLPSEFTKKLEPDFYSLLADYICVRAISGNRSVVDDLADRTDAPDA
jgi:hypothetical protein